MGAWAKNKRIGFTIVELLIVIVVIAILATISIVAYNGIQNRAYNSTVESDLSAALKKIELARIDLGNYPRASSEFPAGFKFSKSAYLGTVSNAMYCNNHDTDEFALGVTSKSGTKYLLTKNGIQKDVPDSGSVGACGAVGTSWASPPGPRTAIHGYLSGGVPPTYTDGWNNSWRWTNNS